MPNCPTCGAKLETLADGTYCYTCYGSICRVCGEPLYRDESIVLNGHGRCHIRCASGRPEARPVHMLTPKKLKSKGSFERQELERSPDGPSPPPGRSAPSSGRTKHTREPRKRRPSRASKYADRFAAVEALHPGDGPLLLDFPTVAEHRSFQKMIYKYVSTPEDAFLRTWTVSGTLFVQMLPLPDEPQ